MASGQLVLIVNMLDAGGTARCKDLSNFDEGQIIMERRLSKMVPTDSGARHKPQTGYSVSGTRLQAQMTVAQIPGTDTLSFGGT